MAAEEIKSLHVVKEVQIAAPPDVVFQTVLEPHGPMKDMNMKLEPWPGGRWFRDLGNNTGHLWGHVQVIKPPTHQAFGLIEPALEQGVSKGWGDMLEHIRTAAEKKRG